LARVSTDHSTQALQGLDQATDQNIDLFTLIEIDHGNGPPARARAA
jgi:hypothetical protein